VHERRGLEIDLRKAIAQGGFELFYQPVVSLARDRISGFEALLRWPHPNRGEVPPAQFVPLAEDTGLIVPIGEWVLRRACADAARWPAEISVAVNISPVQFRSKNLAATVVSALGAAGLAPERLEIEITESSLLHNNEATLAVLYQLQGIGVRVAMDDFGTGYSSLSYLRSFPFDKIKIDQSFIRDLDRTKDAVAIVRAVSSLAAELGMITTAEGVDTLNQLERVRAEGCSEAQGYLFSPPRPASEVPRLLAAPRPKRQAVA
jgi:EAL domain-containing protein (putative c-di-GMP-specific phosphodiesterase class I)